MEEQNEIQIWCCKVSVSKYKCIESWQNEVRQNVNIDILHLSYKGYLLVPVSFWFRPCYAEFDFAYSTFSLLLSLSYRDTFLKVTLIYSPE